MALKDHYEKAYGRYNGPPDYARCCVSVAGHGEWYSRQCARKNGHGPDGAYCKQHDPAAVAKREERAHAKRQIEWERRRKEILGPRWFKVLKQIADGHNAPRSLAQEAIKGFDQ